MSDPFVGEIRLFPYTFAPYGWAECNGALLPVAQFQALYALIGNIFGGTPNQTFNIPDLKDRTIVGQGQGTGLSPRAYSMSGGESSHSLNINEIPSHNHNIIAGSAFSTLQTPVGNYWGVTRYTSDSGGAEKNANSFASTSSPGDLLSNNFVGVAGGNMAHENRQPSLALRYCIALEGVFPTRP